jgi:hypothetical protein
VYLAVSSTTQTGIATMAASLIIIAFATFNLVYWIWRYRPTRRERDQFLKDHGWNYKDKLQGKTRLRFKSGQGKNDIFFIFIVSFQPEAYRLTDLTYKKINEKYQAFFKENVCVIQDIQTNSLSLYKKMK